MSRRWAASSKGACLPHSRAVPMASPTRPSSPLSRESLSHSSPKRARHLVRWASTHSSYSGASSSEKPSMNSPR